MCSGSHQKPSWLRTGGGEVVYVHPYEVVSDLLRRESNRVGIEDEQPLPDSNDRAVIPPPLDR